MALQGAIKYFHMFRIGLLLTLCSKGLDIVIRQNTMIQYQLLCLNNRHVLPRYLTTKELVEIISLF